MVYVARLQYCNKKLKVLAALWKRRLMAFLELPASGSKIGIRAILFCVFWDGKILHRFRCAGDIYARPKIKVQIHEKVHKCHIINR